VSISRRQMLGFAGASAAIAVGGGAIAGAEFARRTAHLRQLSTANHNTTWLSRDPKWLWRFPVTPVIGSLGVTISAANDAVYLWCSTALYSLAADSGHIIWKYPFSQSYPRDLVFGDGVIYLSNIFTDNYNTHLSALSARNGRKLWGRTARNAGISDPVCDGQVIYLGTSPLTSGISYIYALDAVNGKVIWQLSGIDDSPVFATGDILYTLSQSELRARNKNTGEDLWAFPYPKFSNNGGPFLSEGVIYISYDIDPSNDRSQLLAVDAETGRQVWSSIISGGPVSIDVVGGTVFALAVGGGVSALATASGSTAWAQASPSLSSDLAVANDSVLVSGPPNNSDGGVVRPGDLSGETELRALQSTDGQTRWKAASAGGQLTSAPVLVGDWACVGFSQRSIRVLSLSTGRTKWDLPIPVEYGPVVSGDTLFVTAADKISETGNASLSGAVYGIKI
jgi:outer membrane protein assembly factor BamB